MSIKMMLLSLCLHPFHPCSITGRGNTSQIFGIWVQHAIRNWTQSDLSFCKNEGPNKSMINEKGGSIESKIKKKMMQNAYKLLNNTF